MNRTAPILLLLAACAGARAGSRAAPRPTTPADRALIREARIEQNRAMAAGDVDRAASFWTDDVSLRRGLGQLVNGKTEYRRLLFPAGNRDSSLVYQREPTGIDVSPNWSLAFETGTWAGLRGAQGLPTSYVNLTYSGMMIRSLTATEDAASGAVFRAKLIASDEQNARLVDYNIVRYGNWLLPTPGEETEANAAVAAEINRIVANVFAS